MDEPPGAAAVTPLRSVRASRVRGLQPVRRPDPREARSDDQDVNIRHARHGNPWRARVIRTCDQNSWAES